jgi:phosphoglycerol transferase MdoB-like AlkP superfamily enzyme
VSDAFDPYASSKRRAWTALALGVAGVATMPAAVILAHQSHQFTIMDASYAVPIAFVLGLLATGMAARAKRNLAWLRLDEGGTGVASAAVVLGVLALSLALMAALSVGFYEAIRYYQHHH